MRDRTHPPPHTSVGIPKQKVVRLPFLFLRRPASLSAEQGRRPDSMSGCCLNIKIGEAPRPSTYKGPAKPIPVAKTHAQAWQIKSQVPIPVWATDDAVAEDATGTAQAWLSHPANKMQLPSLQKMVDTDGDGVTNRTEFAALLKAAGSGSNANLLFVRQPYANILPLCSLVACTPAFIACC